MLNAPRLACFIAPADAAVHRHAGLPPDADDVEPPSGESHVARRLGGANGNTPSLSPPRRA